MYFFGLRLYVIKNTVSNDYKNLSLKHTQVFTQRPHTVVRFLKNPQCVDRFFLETPYIKFYENSQGESRIAPFRPTNGWTDRHYDAMAAGRNSFTKAPKIEKKQTLDAD